MGAPEHQLGLGHATMAQGVEGYPYIAGGRWGGGSPGSIPKWKTLDEEIDCSVLSQGKDA